MFLDYTKREDRMGTDRSNRDGQTKVPLAYSSAKISFIVMQMYLLLCVWPMAAFILLQWETQSTTGSGDKTTIWSFIGSLLIYYLTSAVFTENIPKRQSVSKLNK